MLSIFGLQKCPEEPRIKLLHYSGFFDNTLLLPQKDTWKETIAVFIYTLVIMCEIQPRAGFSRKVFQVS